MANIDKELEAIQNAVYGEEVRSSIYNGIKAVNDSAVGSAQVCVTKAEEASSSAANAESSASSATTKATESEQSATMARSYATGGTGAREGEDVDNAKYYMEQAKEISQVEIATTEIAGIVKPDGNTIEVDVDGTIKIPDATKEAKGVVKLSDSEDVTDSTGLALPATEKNASIEGTLAHGIAELNSNLNKQNNRKTLLQGGYATPLSQIDVNDLSDYRWLSFCFVWDNAQILDIKTITYKDFVDIARGGVIYLYNGNGDVTIEIRYVDDTHLKINCSNIYAKLRIYGNEFVK